MTVLITLAVIVVLLLVAVIASYNKFVPLRNQAEEAFSTMDICLKKRWDMIPNLVEIVKHYAMHERQTFEAVAQARNMAIAAAGKEERSRSENQLSQTLRSLFAVSESYPQLKADTGFQQLQQQLFMLENEISQSRKYYNGVAKLLNNSIEKFPANIFAGIMGFRSYPYFTVDEPERQNVQIRF